MSTIRARPYLWILVVVALVGGLGAGVLLNRERDEPRWAAAAPSVADVPVSPSAAPPVAKKAPKDLPVVAYAKGPRGLPTDPEPESVVEIGRAHV